MSSHLEILSGSSHNHITTANIIQAHSYHETFIDVKLLEGIRQNGNMDLQALRYYDSEDEANASDGGGILVDGQILPWFQDECKNPGQKVLWLYGNVIRRPDIHTLVKELPKDSVVGVYAAQSTVGSEKALVSNIAYGLIQKTHGLAPLVRRAIDDDPAIFERGFAAQFKNLVILPLQAHVEAEAQCGNKLYPGSTKVFIIDDLDDRLGFDTLQRKLNAITRILQEYKVPLVFFVASGCPPRVEHTSKSWMSGMANFGSYF